MADSPNMDKDNFKDVLSLTDQIISNLNRIATLNREDESSLKKKTDGWKSINSLLSQQADILDKAKKFEASKKDLTKAIDKLEGEITKKINSRIANNTKNLKSLESAQKLNKEAIKSAEKEIKLTQEYLQEKRIELEVARKTKDIDEDTLRSKYKQLNAADSAAKKAQEKLAKERELRTNLSEQKKELESIGQKQEEIRNKIKEQTNESKKLLENYSKNKNILEVSEKLFGKISRIPIAGKLFDAGKAMTFLKDQSKEGALGISSMLGAIGKGLEGLSKASIILAIFEAIYKAVKFLADIMFAADKQVTRLAKNLSLSKEQASGIRTYFTQMKNSLETQYKLTENIIQAQEQLSDLSSATFLYSDKTLDAQIQLTKEYGVSVDEANSLNKLFIANNTVGTDGLHIVMDQVAAYANQNKILFNGKKILSEVSKVSGQLLATFKGSTKALVEAVLRTEKLGMNLKQAQKIGDSLLDFESSIESELEAELLTGKQLNLERARSLALQGDYAAVAEEIASQAGDYTQFAHMNVIQQKALAAAVGMTADELADALMTQKFMGTEAGDQIKRLRAAHQEEQARALAAGDLKGAELEKALKSLDAQEKFNIAIEKAKEAFTDLVDGGTLDKLVDILKGIADSLSFLGSYNAGKNKAEYQDIQEQLKTETNVDKIAALQKRQEEIMKGAEDASKAENQSHMGAVAIGGTIGAIAGSFLGPLGTVAGAYLGGAIAKQFATEDYTKQVTAPTAPATYHDRAGDSTVKYDRGDLRVTDADGNPIAAGTNLFDPFRRNSESNPQMDRLISSMDELLQLLRNPKEVTIMNKLSIDSQELFLEASKHQVQMNS